MDDAAPTLAATQRRLRRWITAPSGVRAVLVGDERAAAEALLRSDRGLDAATRLQVYGHAFFARLHEALAKDYPGLAAELGAETFHALVKGYVHVRPSRFASLRDLGAALADHLERDAVADTVRRRFAHGADLARFEWALVEAFDAADAPVLGRAALGAIAPDRWAEMRFTLAPSLRLLALAYPVHERLAADDEPLSSGSAPDRGSPLAARPVCYRVWRFEEVVRWKEVEAVELALLRDVAAGAPFAALCGRLAEQTGEDGAAARAVALLERWLASGLLSGVEA